MAKVEFAPDGKHYQKIKSGNIMKMWNYFTQNNDMRIQMMLNPSAKFRLKGDDGKVIGVTKYDRKKKEFLHLKEVI